MSQLKIAFCYTGYLRSWEHCWKNQRDNLWLTNTVEGLSNGQCDFYFYTYEDPHIGGDDLIHWRFLWKKIHEPFFPDPFAYHRYSERKAPENTIYQSWNQWLNNMIGFTLIPPGYDVYVRIRPDLKFNGPLDFSKFDYSAKTIYIPEGFDYGGVCDQFAFGNREVMKIYYSMFVNCHDLFHEGVLHHSETMQLKNLEKHGVNIVRFGSPQFDLIR